MVNVSGYLPPGPVVSLPGHNLLLLMIPF